MNSLDKVDLKKSKSIWKLHISFDLKAKKLVPYCNYSNNIIFNKVPSYV